MEIKPFEDDASHAKVIIESMSEELSLNHAAMRNTSLVFMPLGLRVANQIMGNNLLFDQQYPREITLSRWQLAFIANGLSKILRNKDNPTLFSCEYEIATAIHEAGYGRHWSTPIISRHS
jgi:hypothetical protein